MNDAAPDNNARRSTPHFWGYVAWCLVVFNALLAIPGVMPNPVSMLLPLGLLTAAVAGLVFRWGPLVWCLLMGYFFAKVWYRPYLYAHDAYEAMIEDIGWPVEFAVAGLIAGFFLDRFRSSIAGGEVKGKHEIPQGAAHVADRSSTEANHDPRTD